MCWELCTQGVARKLREFEASSKEKQHLVYGDTHFAILLENSLTSLPASESQG